MKSEDVARQKDFLRGRDPKVLCFDLEISPMLAYTYEAYEGNVLRVKVQPQVVAYACSWGGKNITTRILPDYPGYKPGILNLNDKPLVEELWKTMDEADLIYGHNMKAFDIKHARARFLFHGFPVTKKFRIEDTLSIARKYFKFPKNNLDFLTETLGIGTKTEVKHSDVIWGCIDGDMKKWEAMRKYVRRDVEITSKLYEKLSPWNESPHNLNLILRRGNRCPICIQHRRTGEHVVKNGHIEFRLFTRQKWRCRVCGHQWNGEVTARAAPAERPTTEIERVDQFRS